MVRFVLIIVTEKINKAMQFTTQFFELLAFIVGLINYKKLKDTQFGKLVWLLLLVIIAESIGIYQRRFLHIRNAEVYNVSTVIEFIVYAWIFSSIILSINLNKLIKLFILLYPIIWFINIIFIQGFHVFHTYTMTLGSFCMILMSNGYYLDIIKKEKKKNLLEIPEFWFSTGLLFFYSTDIVNSNLIKLTYQIKITKEISLFKVINTSSNVILYSCFIVMFILIAKMKKTE